MLVVGVINESVWQPMQLRCALKNAITDLDVAVVCVCVYVCVRVCVCSAYLRTCVHEPLECVCFIVCACMRACVCVCVCARARALERHA